MRAILPAVAFALAVACTLPAVAQLGLPFGKEPEKLSKSDITKLLALKNGDLDKCRETHRKKEPKVTGKLVARFTVDSSGRTTNVAIVSSEFKGSTFEKCVTAAIKDWTFPKAKQKSDPYDLPQAF